MTFRSQRTNASRTNISWNRMDFKYSSFFFAFSLWALGAVLADIQEVNVELRPDAVPELLWVNLRGPGTIDLSGITVAISKSQPQQYDSTRNATWMDMAVFPLPSSCSGIWSPCHWSEAGVGTNAVKGPTGTEDRLCCDDEAIQMGLCDASDKDHLIINRALFKGQHFQLTVPGKSADWKDHISYNGKSPERLEQSGDYVVMFTNCNTLDGQQLHLTGKLKSISKHGYLPGSVYSLWIFWIWLSVAYLFLFLYYRFLMLAHSESRIAVETWISRIILLVLAEFFFHNLDFFIWNKRGERWEIIQYVVTIVGALKRGASRFCLIYLALGWGAICESVRYFSRCCLAIAATTYAVAYAGSGIMVTHMRYHHDESNPDWISQGHALEYAIAAYHLLRVLDVIFTLWVFYALRSTIHYLQEHQSRSNSHSSALKLMRYFTLRKLFLACIGTFVFSRVAFFFVLEHEAGKSLEHHAMEIFSLVEISYFLLLASIAVLWRPNPRATEYAYNPLEVPILFEEDHELELQENNHPVAGDPPLFAPSPPSPSHRYDNSNADPTPSFSSRLPFVVPSIPGSSQSRYAALPSADDDRDHELPS